MTDRAHPLISILIVNYNGLAHVEECFASIFAQTYPRFEVVMVDNGSRDGSAERVERDYPSVKVVRAGGNLGFAGGNNHGIPHCSGDFIFLLNNDTRMEPDTLDALARAAADHPDVHIFACFLLNYYRPDLADSAGDTLYATGAPFSFQGYPAAAFRLPRFVTCACAGAALYSRECLERTGGFDTDFFLIFEDMDLSLRARHLGYSILFLPAARVHHKSSASLGGKRSPLAIYYCERNHANLLLKNFPLADLLRLVPAFTLMKLAALLKAMREGNLKPFLKGNLEALRLVPGTLRKRKRILGASTLSRPEFTALLRKRWWQERRAFKRGDFGIGPQELAR
ncbi:MAG TPA: glycosyltransferase family 2 protein [Fibrobacteria bacterium]|nr:glycosyltransferase family 2 protein [Fibrobacteria bacterium]